MVEKYCCERCGEALNITRKTIGYEPIGGSRIYRTTWRCPNWGIFHRHHTNVSGPGSFEAALQTRNRILEAGMDLRISNFRQREVKDGQS